MGRWEDLKHKVEVVLGTDEEETVADEATEALKKEADKREDGKA